MAVYFNLAIDCDQDENSAKELTRIFHEFKIPTERFGELTCRSEHIPPKRYWGFTWHKQRGKLGPPSEYAGDWHKVCVSPSEMSMSFKPEYRGILDEPNMNHVRNELYERLKYGLSLGHQFRSAAFGCEFQDLLGEIEWLDDLEAINQTGKLPRYTEGLILNADWVKNDSAKDQLEHFADGYLWWNAPSRGH